MTKEISSKVLEQLSSYLDGQLTEKERTNFEAQLQSDPKLREEFEGLRRTRMLLQQLPKKRVPRNFFITPEMLPKPAVTLRLFPVFRLASAIAVILLVVVFAGDLWVGKAPQSAAATNAPLLAVQSISKSANNSSNSNPSIILWESPTPGGYQLGAQSGLGGSGGGASASRLAPTPGTNFQETPAPGGTEVVPPPAAGTPGALTSEGLTDFASPQTDETPAGTTEDQYASGPILGVNPTEGASQAFDLLQGTRHNFELPRPTLHVVEGILGLLVVIAGVGAFYFYRREHA